MKRAQYTWNMHQEHETFCFGMDAGGNDAEGFCVLPQGPTFTGETIAEWPELGRSDCK